MMYSSAVEPSPIEVIPNIEQRWVSLKTNEANEVIEDLTYMMAVTRISPEDPSRPPEISHRMMHIVSMLRSGKKNHHTRKKIIAVIHKYL